MCSSDLKDWLDVSSSSSLDSSDVNSLPTASSPRPTDDTEVFPNRFLEAPQGDLPDSRSKGDETPRGSKSSSRPDTAPKPSEVPESGRGPPSKRSKSAVPVAPVQLEASDNMLEALQGASIDKGHHTIMSA